MAEKPETVFRRRVVSFLKTLPRTAIFSIQQQAICGTPDLLCCIGGLFVAVEIKSEKGKPSALQTYTLSQIEKAGGVAALLYPKDFESFKVDMAALASKIDPNPQEGK